MLASYISQAQNSCNLAEIVLSCPKSKSASCSDLHQEIARIRQHPVTHRHTEGGDRGNIKRGAMVNGPDYDAAVT